MQDTHFGHPSPRPYTPIDGSPPIGGGGNMCLGVGEPLHGVGWGVGPSSSGVPSHNTVSGGINNLGNPAPESDYM